MIVCFDLETTGLDKKKDDIIEIALVRFDEKFNILDSYTTLVNPGREIPDIAANITHISDEDLIDAPDLWDIASRVREFIGDAPLLGHNVFFDRDFCVEKWIDISDNIVLDTFFLANFLCFQELSLNLEMLCEVYNIDLRGAHRALNDVHATLELFKALTHQIQALPKEEKNNIIYILSESSDRSVAYLKDFLFPEYIDNSYGLHEFRESLLRGIHLPDVLLPLETQVVSSPYENTGDYFSSQGGLETRENQQQMSDIIMDNFSQNGHVAIDAPTGLWKTYAYLIPSIIHAKKTGEKVYIATKTKQLQDQLFFKDCVFLQEQENGLHFTSAKLKWKNNYLSILEFIKEIELGSYSYQKTTFLLKLIRWIWVTHHGETDEIGYYGEENKFIRYLTAEDPLILTDKNPYKAYEYLYNARETAESSDIVIINHSLLFAEVQNSFSAITAPEHIIFDEAHNIEESITEALRKKASLWYIQDIFHVIEGLFDRKNIPKIPLSRVKDNYITHLSYVFDELSSYLSSQVSQESPYKITLLKTEFYQTSTIQLLAKKITKAEKEILQLLETTNSYNFSKEIVLLKDFFSIIGVFLDENNTESIKILTENEYEGFFIEYTLLNPGSYLKKHLWSNLKTTVLTSATLKTAGNFDYITQLLSLQDFEFYAFETDFDYSKQATLFMVNDLWSIKNNSTQVVEFLSHLYGAVWWRVLTLLTSFSMIRKIYTHLYPHLKSEWITLYAQSIGGSKAKLFHNFTKKPDSSILLWTNSFWEGINIEWDALQYLVIHKFPFPVPTDPIFLARSQLFDNPFAEYSIPKAIIKLQQGFGRLIRSKTDTGVVILLDDRIYSTNWGQVLLSAFPENIRIKKTSTSSLIQLLKDYKNNIL